MADWVYTPLCGLNLLFPLIFYSMYTDIPPLPLIALQLGLASDLFKGGDSGAQWKTSLLFGLLSGLTMLIRPTTIIVVIAFWMVLSLKGSGRSLVKSFALTLYQLDLVYGALGTAVKHQTAVPILEGKVWPRVLSCLLTWA